MNKTIFLLFTGIAIFMCGCTLAPKYVRPQAPVPATWPTGTAYPENQAMTNATDARQLPWQEFFTDSRMRQIIELALTNNRNLRLAALNVERARAIYGIQRASLWPAVNAAGSGVKQRLPADLSSSGERQTVEQYEANLGVFSWEIDFFGRLRSLKNRALEEYLASEQGRRGAQILLISSVANTYLLLAADQENLKLAESTYATRQGAYNLTKRRYDLGLVPELDLLQVQTQVDAARGAVARFTQQVAQDANALNLLAGTSVPTELLPPELGKAAPFKEIIAGMSSELLLRRPDVLQAESLLKAANADIGAARAAFFPNISLTAAVGTASSELSGLFKAGSGTWSYAPQIAMPIFDTRVWSAHKAAKVQREIAVTQYEKAIQSAFREVADALAIRGTVGQQLSAQTSLVEATARGYKLSEERYRNGIDSYLTVLDAQRSLYSAQQSLISLRLAQMSNLVTLYMVLGGG